MENIANDEQQILALHEAGDRALLSADLDVLARIFAVVHGSESDEVEAGGKRIAVRYVYLDVLRKCDGEWKLVASQLARPVEK